MVSPALTLRISVSCAWAMFPRPQRTDSGRSEMYVGKTYSRLATNPGGLYGSTKGEVLLLLSGKWNG